MNIWGSTAKKSVRAIGQVTDIIITEMKDGKITYKTERGKLTDDMKVRIAAAMEDGKKYGYDMSGQRYFFVDEFYDTDFKKITPRAPMGSRMFDLTEILGIEKLPDVKTIAEMLKDKTWS